jgi:hypothetical protein
MHWLDLHRLWRSACPDDAGRLLPTGDAAAVLCVACADAGFNSRSSGSAHACAHDHADSLALGDGVSRTDCHTQSDAYIHGNADSAHRHLDRHQHSFPGASDTYENAHSRSTYGHDRPFSDGRPASADSHSASADGHGCGPSLSSSRPATAGSIQSLSRVSQGASLYCRTHN